MIVIIILDNPLLIPPNWNLAKIHAKSRETKKEFPQQEGVIQDTCNCCGYEIFRQPLGLNCNVYDLAFIGAGIPMFYIYIKWCILILLNLFIFEGIPFIIINLNGNYCNLSFEEYIEQKEIVDYHDHFQPCMDNWLLKMSISNIVNQKDLQIYNEIIFFIQYIIILIELFFFRYYERKVANVCDDLLVTCQDFSIMVRNIPIDDEIDVEQSIKYAFEECLPQKIKIVSINIIYDLTDIEHMEEDLNHLIKKKQNFLKKIQFQQQGFQVLDNDYTLKKKQLNTLHFNTNQDYLNYIDKQINNLHHHIEESLEKLNQSKGKKKFTGNVIVIFNTEREKSIALKYNTIQSQFFIRYKQWASIKQSYKNYDQIDKYYKKIKYLQEHNNLVIAGHYLFVTEAPEPNDVDWEFINVTTNSKIFSRLYSWVIYLILLSLGYLIIYYFSNFKSVYIEQSFEDIAQNVDNPEKYQQALNEFKYVKISLFAIGFLIVAYNKFLLPHLIHRICDQEKHSTKTKLNQQFAFKLTIGLFFNTAIITFAVEVLAHHNFYGVGGMIESEFAVFIMNAIIPAGVWFIDPWNIYQKIKQKHNLKIPYSVLTQQQANELMEFQSYSVGKRYADIMKTMWFTFMYSPAIPISSLISTIGLVLYYYADKYNLIFRRTVKEGISKEISFYMIEMLEIILLLHAFGQLWNTRFVLHNKWYILSLVMFIIGFIYTFVLDIQNINEKLLKIENNDEIETYKDNYIYLDDDYDRCNPVTKKNAIKNWIEMRKNYYK